MLDTLEIFGDEFTSVTGIKATNDDNETVIFLHLADGDNLGYGVSANNIVGLAIVGTATLGSESMVGTGTVGSAIVGG